MTPKEKAKELIEKFTKPLGYYEYHLCEELKDCATVCVDEIIEELKVIGLSFAYWGKVKEEINKL